MQSSKDVDEALDTRVPALGVADDGESAGEQLLVRDDVGRPVEGVAAVVDCAAALGLLVDGAQELPLRGPHLGARGRAARGVVEQEPHDEGVALRDEESAELVEPDGAFDARGGLGQLEGGFAGYGLRAAGRVVVVHCGEMLLKLESRVELHGVEGEKESIGSARVQPRQQILPLPTARPPPPPCAIPRGRWSYIAEGNKWWSSGHIGSFGAWMDAAARVGIQDGLLHLRGMRACRRPS